MSEGNPNVPNRGRRALGGVLFAAGVATAAAYVESQYHLLSGLLGVGNSDIDLSTCRVLDPRQFTDTDTEIKLS